ncbi:hypothetical protein KQI88_12965 [Alkaliphilus sp. MSJ-5]|uniref:Rhamnogalacturonan lyase domain-containing protein n=1 Tax=Alkaliphilus flagellatus TaxID=2841507 RepID=A0ABS6G7B3_9FIRM|nr:hypothetical protein [Alkaliphilus flagellatus]
MIISWDQKGLYGKILPPGKYMVSLTCPSKVNYTIEGSEEIKTENIYSGMGWNLNYFWTEFR